MNDIHLSIHCLVLFTKLIKLEPLFSSQPKRIPPFCLIGCAAAAAEGTSSLATVLGRRKKKGRAEAQILLAC